MKQRILTAILALIIFVPFVLYGSWPFILFVYLLASIGLRELLLMGEKANNIFLSIISYLTLWVILLPFNSFKLFTIEFTKIEVIIIFVMLLLFYTVLTKNKFNFTDAGFVLLSTIYVGIGFYFLILTRIEGLNFVLFTLFSIWATDTGAYFVGRSLGKRKLWPEISPNKTIEGAIGGILSAVIVGLIFYFVYPFEQTVFYIIIVIISISAIGQIGDLAASAYKRHYHVKDSGKLLPGHGGILDRMDSLIFVLPFLYVLQFIG